MPFKGQTQQGNKASKRLFFQRMTGTVHNKYVVSVSLVNSVQKANEVAITYVVYTAL